MKTRSQGHVGQRGDKWFFKLELAPDPATGKRRFRWETFGTEKQASDALAVARKERDKGALVTNSRATVAQWCDTWLADYAPLEVSAASLQRYKDALKHVTRHVGAVKLTELSAEQLQGVWTKLVNGYAFDGEQIKLERVSAALVRTVFTRVLKTAVRFRKVAVNVALSTTLPKAPKSAVEDEERAAKAFTQAEVGRILRGLLGREDDMHTAAAIAAGTGLRRGEVCALRWLDIEPDAIQVRGNIDGTGARKAPKTKSSRRRVPIAGELVSLIAAYRARMVALGLRMGRRLEAEDYLFPVRPDAPTEPQHPRAFGARFEYAVKRMGVKEGHFHRLRHYHATILLERGERVEVVAQRLGHSTPAITLSLYAGVLEHAKSKAAATAGAVLDEALAWQPAQLQVVNLR